jgi:hypothetical protein
MPVDIVKTRLQNQKVRSNQCAKSSQYVGDFNLAKIRLSGAKLKARSEASRKNISNFDF